jgi:hypothetical protein
MKSFPWHQKEYRKQLNQLRPVIGEKREKAC